MLATLGTPVVAAYAISQRIIRFARLPSNGIGTATASLVGQELGAGEEQEAEVYGTQITWISIVLQGGTAVVIMAFAPVLVGLFGLGNRGSAWCSCGFSGLVFSHRASNG